MHNGLYFITKVRLINFSKYFCQNAKINDALPVSINYEKVWKRAVYREKIRKYFQESLNIEAVHTTFVVIYIELVDNFMNMDN